MITNKYKLAWWVNKMATDIKVQIVKSIYWRKHLWSFTSSENSPSEDYLV